ncbi:MAG: hypothetical protein ACRD1X_10245 [Vicinamibacteria bacterium]
MAFGGLGGIAGGILIQATSIHPAGQYVSVSQNGRPSLVVADNIFWRKNGPGETVPGIENSNNAALQYISIAAIATDVEVNFLAACDTDETTDQGTLVTHIPVADQHGLPANFGRGRNRWRPGDEDYINVWFRMPQVCQVGTGTFPILAPDVVSVTFVQFGTSADAQSALGDIRILFANRGGAAIPAGLGFPNPTLMIFELLH